MGILEDAYRDSVYREWSTDRRGPMEYPLVQGDRFIGERGLEHRVERIHKISAVVSSIVDDCLHASLWDIGDIVGKTRIDGSLITEWRKPA